MYLTSFEDVKPLSHPTNIAYTMQTSGTTGEPKLVFVSHASILPNIVDIVREFSLDGTNLVLLSSPLTFDPSLVDIFVSLVSGAGLLVLPTSEKIKPSLYSLLFEKNRVTALQCTPALLENIFAADFSAEKTLCSLRLVAVGGDRCSHAAKTVLRKLADSALGVRIYHLYGLTEMSVWQSMIKVSG